MIFRGLAEQDDSIPPPSLWAKKLFELRMITGDLILLDEYKVLHTLRFCFSWCSDSTHIREHCRSAVSSPCIRQLSSFRMRRRKAVRKTVVAHFSACGAVCLFVSTLPAPCQKFSLRQLAGACPRGFRRRSESVRSKTDWKG